MLKALFMGLAGLLLAGQVSAAEPSEATCRNSAGQRINSAECNTWFKANAPLGSDQACASNAACRREREARGDRQAQARDQEHREQLAAVAKADAALQAECGDDLNRPRVGMPAQRALRCVQGLSVVGEEQQAAGVVHTYDAGGAYLRVAGGKVVAVGRY